MKLLHQLTILLLATSWFVLHLFSQKAEYLVISQVFVAAGLIASHINDKNQK
jgi:hypothetical protein